MAQLFTFHLGTTGKAATTGYEFFDEAGASLGARSTTGVTEIGTTGIYFRTQALPAGAVAVVWNDTDTGRWAVDDFISRAGGGLDAAGVRSALGMAGADLDTQLDTIFAATASEAAGVIAVIPTVNNIASAALKLDWTTLTGEPVHCLLNAGRTVMNAKVPDGTNLLVKKEDGTTTAVTIPLVTVPAGDPVTGTGDPT